MHAKGKDEYVCNCFLVFSNLFGNPLSVPYVDDDRLIFGIGCLKNGFMAEHCFYWVAMKILPQLTSLVAEHQATDGLSVMLFNGKLGGRLMTVYFLRRQLVHITCCNQWLISGNANGWKPCQANFMHLGVGLSCKHQDCQPLGRDRFKPLKLEHGLCIILVNQHYPSDIGANLIRGEVARGWCRLVGETPRPDP